MKNTLNPGSIALGLTLMLAPFCQAQTWSGEQDVGGYLLGMPGVAQISGSNVLQVFYAGGDGALWTRWRNTDGSWSQEQSLGNQLFRLTCADVTNSSCWGNTATPAAIQIPAAGDFGNTLGVFYRGLNNDLVISIRNQDGIWGGRTWEGNSAAIPQWCRYRVRTK
jgi:hypothetical protein